MAQPKGRQAPPPQPTVTLNHWRERGQGVIKTLPSGGNARIKRPSLLAMARTGHVPNPLLEEVLPHLLDRDTAEPETLEARIEHYHENADAYVRIAAIAMAEPRIVLDRAPDYDAGEIAPEDLSTPDLLWIYHYVVNEVEISLEAADNATFPQSESPGGAA